MARTDVEIRSLITATDIDTLPDTSVIEDRGEYVVIRSPSNPSHYWGNFLVWRSPPVSGDRERWEAAFEAEFGVERESTHVAFSWDVPGGGPPGEVEQFVEAGYEADGDVGLIATPAELTPHPRAATDVTIELLDPEGDEQGWLDAIELQVENRDAGHDETFHRRFVERRMADRRERFLHGDGGWFLARTREGDVAASCGVIVTQGRARFQAVDTLERFRRRGIASRLVHDVGRAAIDRFGAETLVIVAEAGYHALPLYESLGFVQREHGFGLCWWPGSEHAGRHPRFEPSSDQ
ncbi:MAG: GCN5-related N-acetyltransferase [Thermoleophilia bacterium]|nr:GCN5-related N-acetyltransferase [Thermoleophilia bacterium]